MNQYKRELSDTEALSRKGIQPAQLCTADESPKPALGSADRAVTGSSPGRFRRETGAGTEGLAAAVKIASCEE